MPYFYGFDWTYLVFVIPAIVLSLWAQIKVSSTFKKYSSVPSDGGMTGADAARMVLEQNGVTNVQIVPVKGNLTDHYDPKDNIIRLSEPVYAAKTASAVGVAAHEAGHAVQYARGYSPIKLRAAIIPISKVGSTLALPLVIIGLIFSWYPLAYAGVILFGAAVLFQLVTLPVEFNASRRAVECLSSSGRISEHIDLKEIVLRKHSY
ncbi:MAG: zinc metallopeptidase, partial [Clostridia bacterium]|nr:zinc metallopeptidase [Clostridia bacterium]